MNADLRRGAVDGRARFLRPDAGAADETAAKVRADLLHPQWYGTMGISQDDTVRIEQALPGAVRKS